MSAVRPAPSPVHPQVGRGATEGEETDMMSGPPVRSAMAIHLRQVMRPDDEVQQSISTESAAGSCPVCPHPADAHDAIGARFCAATAAGKFERGCVCPAGEAAR